MKGAVNILSRRHGEGLVEVTRPVVSVCEIGISMKVETRSFECGQMREQFDIGSPIGYLYD